MTNSELNKIDYYYGSVTELVLVVDGGLIMPRADEISSSSRIVWTWVLLYTRLSRFLTSDIVVEFLFKNVVFKKVENDDHELSCQTKRKLPKHSLFVEFYIYSEQGFSSFLPNFCNVFDKGKQLWSRLFKHDFKFFRCKTFLALWYKTLRARTYPMTHECNFSTN